jgi:hypothetical protein
MSAPERLLRFLQFAGAVSVPLIVEVCRVTHPEARPIGTVGQWVFALLAIVSGALALWGHQLIAHVHLRSPKSVPLLTPLGRWILANVSRLSLAQSISLYAFVLHILGGSAVLVYVLFGSSLLLLLLLRPGTCPSRNV